MLDQRTMPKTPVQWGALVIHARETISVPIAGRVRGVLRLPESFKAGVTTANSERASARKLLMPADLRLPNATT